MIERLALPSSDAAPLPLEAWTDLLGSLGHPATVSRGDDGAAWIEVSPLRLRGYILMEGDFVEAINFDLHAPDPTPALALIEAAANRLGWEIHDETDDEDDE